MPFYLDYVAAGGKYMQMPATPTPFGVVASAQNFKLTINIKCVGANPIVLGSTVDDSSFIFPSATQLQLKGSVVASSALYTITSNLTDFREIELSRTDGANVVLKINGTTVDTKPFSSGLNFNRLAASNLGVSAASFQLKYIKLEKDGALSYNWENTTGTGTQMPDTVGARPFNQIGTWPADNSEWVSYSAGGTPPTGTVTIGSITPNSTGASVPFTYSAADQTGFEYRLNGGAAVTGTASPQVLTGLTSSTAYTIEIRAINASGQGAWSTAANFTTSAPAAQVPQGAVTIGTVTTTQTTASVPYTYSLSDQTGFEYRLSGGAAVTATASPQSLTGLTANTAYTIEIRAINATGAGTWSAVKNFTTAAVAVGTITITDVANNIDTPWASAAVDAATIMPLSLGSVVVNKTGLSTTAGADLVITDAAIVTGTEYIIILKIGTAYGWYRAVAT